MCPRNGYFLGGEFNIDLLFILSSSNEGSQQLNICFGYIIFLNLLATSTYFDMTKKNSKKNIYQNFIYHFSQKAVFLLQTCIFGLKLLSS